MVTATRQCVSLGIGLLSMLLLSDRKVCAIPLTWTGGGDGFTWLDANNWEDNQGMAPALPPSTSDDVMISSMATVEVNGPAGANTLTVGDALLKVLSELTVLGSANVNRLELHGDIINSDTFTIAGNSEWKNGRFLGSGIVENSGTFAVTGGTTRLIQGKLFRNNGTLGVGTQIDLESAILENNNLLELDNTISQRGLTPSEVVNMGTIRGTGFSGSLNVPLRNLGGTLHVEFGGLDFDRRVEMAGGLLMADVLSTLTLSGTDDHLFSGAVTAIGDGEVRFQRHIVLEGTLTNQLDDAQSGLFLESRLSGSGSLVNNAIMTWNNGSLEVATATNNFAFVLKGGVKNLNTTFRNLLNTSHQTGSLTISASHAWINEAGSQYSFSQTSGPGIAVNGAGTFVNRGRLLKTGVGMVNVSSPSSHESGTIDVEEGELIFSGNSLHTGSGEYEILEPAQLIINDASHTFSGQHRISGKGVFGNHGPSMLSIAPGSSLTVEMQNGIVPQAPGIWDLSGDIVVGGELINDTLGSAFWVDSTIQVDAGGAFINRGLLFLFGSSGRTLSGPGKLLNEKQVEQFQALTLAGTDGGIENESGSFWTQYSNLTFENGATGKDVRNLGTWKFKSDSTIFDPGGILANNVFRNEGAVEVNQSRVIIHSQFVSDNGTLTLVDRNVPLPPLDPLPRSELFLTGGGQFVGTQIVLGDDARLDLTGGGSGRTYVFQGPGTSVVGAGSVGLAAEMRIGPGARIVAIGNLLLNVMDLSPLTGANSGVRLDGGLLDSGNITNQGLFRWQNGGIGANLINTGNMVVQTSGNHNLTGSLTNATTGNNALVQQATIRLDASAGGPVVASNQGTWIMEPGAVVASVQTAPDAVLRNETGGQILVAPRESGTVAIINAPFENQGEVVVGDNSIGAATAELHLTSNSGVINGLGVLHSGRWIAAQSGVIQFPEPIKVIGPGVFVNGTTVNIPALSGLEANLGEWEVFNAEIFRSVENRGKIFYGHKFVDPNTQIEPPRMFFDGDIQNKPTGEFDSAVDQSDNVTPTALVASLIAGLHDHAASHSLEDCVLSDVAIDVGIHRFVNEGILRPGAANDPGAFPLKGDFFQDVTGVLEIDLGGTEAIVEHDQSIICGEAELGGTLDVQILTDAPQVYEPAWGDQFELLIATQGIIGTFDNVLLPTLESRLDWNLVYEPLSVRLNVVLSGDFDLDGDVDGRDFLLWQMGQSPDPQSAADLGKWQANFGVYPGDFDGDGDGDGRDFLVWQRGNSPTVLGAKDLREWQKRIVQPTPIAAVGQTVPEATCCMLILSGLLLAGGSRYKVLKEF